MKRVLLGLCSVLMILAGAALLAFSGWIYVAFGINGVASSSLGEIASAPTSSAIVIDVNAARVRMPVLPVHGTTTLRLTSVADSTLLAGSSDRETVDAYVGTRDLDAAYRTDGTWTLTHVPGTQDAGDWSVSPTWLSQGHSVDIAVADGQTVLIANADGSPNVHVMASLRFEAPGVARAVVLLSASGAVLVLAGLSLAFGVIWLMRRRRDALAE